MIDCPGSDARAVVEQAREGQAAYRALIDQLQSAEIRTVLKAAGKSERDFIRDVLVDDGKPRPGDLCPQCGDGWLTVYCTKRHGDSRIQYLRCAICGNRPAANKRSIPAGTRKRGLRTTARSISV